MFRRIRVDEDLSVDGKVENLENVRWHNARIMQNDEKIEVSIILNNESKDKKIEAKTLTVRLLNKEGKEIASKDVKMNEISDNYGYTDIEAEFESNFLGVTVMLLSFYYKSCRSFNYHSGFQQIQR